eukprot:TRINITY_DN80671_c0_g1_i1.p1 TRINITY_DN80671_c0_g1~~TRINITY_DN80671_c0_g1_i1.p1  ORF type:complete len:436 (+),score=64.23 TRINITY_DN80671_c0_g1_i1:26-1333(+)
MDSKPAQRRSLVALPDECWLRVLSNLEATELSGSTSAACSRLRQLAGEDKLWQALLRVDFCASSSQQALLLAWVATHQQVHPRQLYVFKRREHLLDLDIARAELQQRSEQAKEQERKQRRIRVLNYVLVRIMHMLLCLSLLATSTLLWLRFEDKLQLSFYAVFAPLFVFEVFLVISASVTFVVFFQRSSSGWTFYWNRLQGVVRWFILYTSPGEGIFVLLTACAVAPLAACSLEGDLRLPWPHLQYLPPFAASWLAGLCMAGSLLRRRPCSSSCIGSCLLLWVPLTSFSVLLFLRISVLRQLPPAFMLLPPILVTTVLTIFTTFLTVASFWLGWRGNRDWLEYATATLMAVLTVLLPILLMEIAMVAYLKGFVPIRYFFVPWTTWLSGILLFTIRQSFMPLAASPTASVDQLPWRADTSDTELLLPPALGPSYQE